MKENIFTYIETCLNEETLPHAFLVETNNVEKANKQIIDFLCKKQLLKQEEAANNLNLVKILPEGKEIKTAEIDNLRARFATLPSNDKYNIYIVHSAEKMNTSAANKLLKFLEEPTDFILGFLIVNKDSSILETIKSRCQEFKLEFESEISELTEQIEEVIKFLENIDYKKEIELRSSLNNLERSEVITVVEKSLSILANKLPKDAQFTITISSNILLLDNVLRLLKSNVNIDLALDKLFIEAR